MNDALLKGRYEILEILGRGGQGETFLARDTHDDRLVAVMRLSVFQAQNWKGIELFEREAEALSRLSHEAIPSYLDSFHIEDDDEVHFYLVQRYIEGEDLLRQMKAGLRFDEDGAKAFLKEMLEILVYLHGFAPPIIHRDIKPSNIMRRPDGSLALIDFGAVQTVIASTLGGSTIVGTTGFIAPEQFFGQALPASDLYSLGATMVQLLTHKHPSELEMEMMKLQFRNFINVSEELILLLERLLEPTVEDRFQSAREALDYERNPFIGRVLGSINAALEL
ncbi:MAG: serine/threonine protein kinase [Bradymonadaceae bacterium]